MARALDPPLPMNYNYNSLLSLTANAEGMIRSCRNDPWLLAVRQLHEFRLVDTRLRRRPDAQLAVAVVPECVDLLRGWKGQDQT